MCKNKSVTFSQTADTQCLISHLVFPLCPLWIFASPGPFTCLAFSANFNVYLFWNTIILYHIWPSILVINIPLL